ncbi:MAG: thioredoxin family protein [Alphaproteobacteria bacterium]|nr:thioredoxin family protein [Alphaproteobacteria bacterium]
MLSRRSLLQALAMTRAMAGVMAGVMTGLLAGAPAGAAERADYSAAAFDAAQQAGRPILVEIHASWCPTCKAQTPILADIEQQPDYKNLLVVHVDFDTQKDAVTRFGARMQSTLIAFKGKQETGRSVGDTNPTSLAALVAKTI